MRVRLPVALLCMATTFAWTAAPRPPWVPSPRPIRAFAVGEHSEYEVRYGAIRAGVATLNVAADTLRGHGVYRFRMTLNGGVNLLLYKYDIRDTTESWVDTATFQSLRFVQTQLHRGKPRNKHYEIYPDRQTFSDGGKPEQPSVREPLDDISLLYFARTMRLDVGTSVEIGRHFKPGSNPIVLAVLRRDTIQAMGRTWNTIVVRPVIKTSRMFADGEGLVWLSDDSTRTVVQLSAKVPLLGALTMKLRSYNASE